MNATTQDLANRVRALPGMSAVLPAIGGLPPLYLVGGAVRDLLRGEISADVDLAVEGDALAAARALADRLGGDVQEYGRFGTAVVSTGALSVDLAGTRRETYASPGALPEVEPGPLTDDLARRDFTVNAMAIPLGEGAPGDLIDPHGGAVDLAAGQLRVLHARSFLDDPTRILRGLRYESRLGLSFAPETEGLARAAIEAGAMATISGDRTRSDLLALLAERPPVRGLEHMRDMGLARALDPGLVVDSGLAAAAALAADATDADPALAGLAAMLPADPGPLTAWIESLGLERGEREAVLRAASRAPVAAQALRQDLRDSELHDLLQDEPPETLALAMAFGAAPGRLERYLTEIREVVLEITGADLVDAGLPESPALGRALRDTLHRKLDGELSGRDAELEHALAVARGVA